MFRQIECLVKGDWVSEYVWVRAERQESEQGMW